MGNKKQSFFLVFCFSLLPHQPFREPLGAKGNNVKKPPSSPPKEEWGRAAPACGLHWKDVGFMVGFLPPQSWSAWFPFHTFPHTVYVPWFPVDQIFALCFLESWLSLTCRVAHSIA